jgi:hypothetical protein
MSSEQEYRERECVHRARGPEGEYYSGVRYVKCLQRLRSGAALSFAGKVAPFFWSDAGHVIVWLCRECADELGLKEGDAHAA